MKALKKIFLSLFMLTVSGSVKAEDLQLSIKESMVNKAISSKKSLEWKDKNQGLYIKLTDLSLKLKDGYILGKANINKFEQTNSGSGILNTLLQRASTMEDLATVQLKTQVGLSDDHKKVILKNTNFIAFDNQYLPSFIEKRILPELNRKIAKEIDGKILYEFPKEMPVEIVDLAVGKQAIEIKGNVIGDYLNLN